MSRRRYFSRRRSSTKTKAPAVAVRPEGDRRGWHVPIDPATLPIDGMPIPLDPDQRAALDVCLSGEPGSSVFVTGPAGCGKSQVIKALKHLIPDLAVTATTGMAALQVGGTTVDRYFGFSRRNWRIRNVKQTLATMRGSTGIVLLDEASAVGVEMARSIWRSAQENGKRIVMFGDLAQTKPVKDEWAVGSNLFAKARVVRLTTNHRQAAAEPQDRLFLQALGRIRTGVVDEVTEMVLQQAIVPGPPADDRWTRMFAVNDMTESFNRERLFATVAHGKRGALLSHFAAAGKARIHPKSAAGFLEGANLGHDVSIGDGARVIITTNDPDHKPWMTLVRPRFANGDAGIVEDVTWTGPYIASARVRLDRTGQVVDVQATERAVIGGNGRPVGTVIGVPLRLGWSVTIHRTQGMTLDRAYVDMGSIMRFPADSRHGLAYVACSRVRSITGLQISNWCRAAVCCDDEVRHLL